MDPRKDLTIVEVAFPNQAAAIREKREPNASLEQCLPAMRILDRLEKSLATHP